MSVLIPLWYALMIGAALGYFGFCYGKSRGFTIAEGAEGDSDRKMSQTQAHTGCIVSPTTGEMESGIEEEDWSVRIMSTESTVSSPVSGRILEIGPRGNDFLILADWGGEIRVRACNSNDDLLDRYFRPRVVRGEIVKKGKLLLEYDREKLSGQCTDTAVYLSARGEQADILEPVETGWIQTGEILARVC